ncbi:toxin transporter [Duganella rhizosphaerae]|uniref:peptidase domain-containing ABC transporter n=1 Tax=Duganella rhizosphaerae TaxID=2885763 RepID=UPI0030E90BEA
MQIKELKFGWRKRLPIVVQTEASECALACLAMVACYFGYETDLAELRKRFAISLKGATLIQVAEIADQLGMVSRPLRVELEELPELQLPAILHWNLNHFVVLKSVGNAIACIHDPAVGELHLTLKQVSNQFTGVVLELSPGLAFQRKAPPPPLQLRALMGRVVGLKRGLLQLAGLAVVLELFSLVLPMITQWVTDDAITTGDRNLLAVLAWGMIAIGVSSALIGAARSWIGIYISTNFNLQWMSNVMGRLLKLPVEYFERRHLGDIVSRFGAVKAIEHSLTSATVEAMLDGILTCGTLVMMLLYSPVLAAVTVGVVLFYALLRWFRYDTERMAASGVIAKQAREQTYFLETIRGVRSIKMLNRENERRGAWLNLWVDAANAGLAIQKLALFFSTSWSLLSTVERTCVFWLGAIAVIDHRLSLGMLLAFLSYKEQFTARINNLIERYIEFRMLSISMERLSDIVLSTAEEPQRKHKTAISDDLTLSFEQVSFGYAEDETGILEKADLSVPMGQCLAIVGPSGCGKSTCMKLLLGILKPRAGKVKIGTLTLGQVGLRNYRNIIATVMQDDHLFAGSVCDNIALLDPRPDMEWIMECARTACIHDEIVEMAMGYHTLVGDMGTVLSGGQKQRILLARALYRRPKIIFLDEATSHLDIENEAKIGKAISAINITRILIAHRPQTIAIADRVVQLKDGKLCEVLFTPEIEPAIRLKKAWGEDVSDRIAHIESENFDMLLDR